MGKVGGVRGRYSEQFWKLKEEQKGRERWKVPEKECDSSMSQSKRFFYLVLFFYFTGFHEVSFSPHDPLPTCCAFMGVLVSLFSLFG